MCIDMTPVFLPTIACASLLILLTCSTAVGSEGQNTTCVSSYYQFEEAAITNNSENTYMLFSTLYKPNEPLPYSVTVFYQVKLPNGTTQRISSDPNCPSELWLWTYSPVFLMAEPSLFNRFTAYTLNYFRRWRSPTVALTVPLPCEASTFDFLSKMTMSINDYAQGRTLLDTNHFGYVQRGCGRTVEETDMRPIIYSGKRTVEIKYIYINLLVGGVLFQSILICLGTALLLQRWLPAIASQSLHCPKVHSMFWAAVTTAIIAWIVFMSVNTYTILTMYWHGHDVITATSAVLAYTPTFLELPVAVYFARKYSFVIPCVYLAPVKLLCCGRQSRAALLVRVMSLWLSLAVIQLACVNGTFIVIAIAAAPFPVISNVLAILFTFFCLFHLFTVIFNLPHLQRRKSNINKPSGVKFGFALLQGVAFFFFLVTLVCYVIAGARFSYIINTQRDRGVILELGNVILPVALGITGFGLRMLSKMWWSNIVAGSSEGEEEEQNLMTVNDGREPA